MNRLLVVLGLSIILNSTFIIALQNAPQKVTSNPPIPTELKKGKEVKTRGSSGKQEADDNSSVSTSPAVQVNLTVSPQSQPKTTESGANKNSETSEDWRIVLFTGILAVVAVLQLIAMAFQSKYMRDQLGQMRTQSVENATSFSTTIAEMQQQTRLTTKGMTLAYRPKLIVRRFESGPLERLHTSTISHTELDKTPRVWSVRFEVVNAGGAQATLFRYCAGLYISKERLPMIFPVDVGSLIELENSEGMKLISGKSLQLPSHERQMTDDEILGVLDGSKVLYILGWVDYKDALDNVRRTAFCRGWETPRLADF